MVFLVCIPLWLKRLSAQTHSGLHNLLTWATANQNETTRPIRNQHYRTTTENHHQYICLWNDDAGNISYTSVKKYIFSLFSRSHTLCHKKLLRNINIYFFWWTTAAWKTDHFFIRKWKFRQIKWIYSENLRCFVRNKFVGFINLDGFWAIMRINYLMIICS